jgi:hypothetical protein
MRGEAQSYCVEFRYNSTGFAPLLGRGWGRSLLKRGGRAELGERFKASRLQIKALKKRKKLKKKQQQQ